MKNNTFILKIKKRSNLPNLSDKLLTIDLSDNILLCNSKKIADSENLIASIRNLYNQNKDKLISATNIMKSGTITRLKNTAVANLYIKDDDVEINLDCYVQEIGIEPMNMLNSVIRLVLEYQSLARTFERAVYAYKNEKNYSKIRDFCKVVVGELEKDPYWAKTSEDILNIIILYNLKSNIRNFKYVNLNEIFIDEYSFINICNVISENDEKGSFLKNISGKQLDSCYQIICNGLKISQQDKTLGLLNKENFKNLFSACIGKVYSNQIELKEYLGEYARWDTDISLGKLVIDNKEFDVQYIGLESKTENMWFSAETEKQIPDEFVKMIIETRKYMDSKGLIDYYYFRKTLNDDLSSDMIAMIYTALATSNTCYFKGNNGDLSMYMYIKNLPETIFDKVGSRKFVSRVMDIIQKFDVNHKLMIKTYLINNNCGIIEDDNKIVGLFDNNSEITFNFGDDNKLQSVDGELK